MSRVAKLPITIPAGIELKINDHIISINGKNGALTCLIHETVEVQYTNNQLTCWSRVDQANSWAIAGTTRSLINSMVIGVTDGFTKKIQLVGVGYRATLKENNIVNLSIGFSHSIDHQLPTGIKAECSSSQTEILLKGADKQLIGQVAADLRAYRSPDPYKGKGLRYAEEVVYIKETKKK